MLHDFSLSHTDTEPLYIQFEAQIRARIESGVWKPGDRIPSERDLMKLASVSRATVRQTLAKLVDQKLLEKIVGKGTFVRPPRYEQHLTNVYSFSAQLRALGYDLIDQILRAEIIDATPDIAARLHLNISAQVIYIRRLRFLRGTPMMVNIAYLPANDFPGLIEKLPDHSLYELMAYEYDYPVIAATDYFDAIGADANIAALLQLSPGTSIMSVERIATTHDARVIHHGYNYIRGDMCRFRSDMYGSSLEIKA